jgi:hypothetical protein
MFKTEQSPLVQLTYPVVNVATLRRTIEQGRRRHPDVTRRPLSKGTRHLLRSGPNAIDGIIQCMEQPLKPGEWIDDLPEPLETVADVEELSRMVDALKAKRLAEAIRKAALN